MITRFISDLHLDPERPEAIEALGTFLQEIAAPDAELYILGDLFEYWLGDDDPAPACRQAADALKDAGTRGLSIAVMHGNRDFLLAEDFARHTGCRLLPEPAVITLHDQSVLLLHGDTLCTDDVEYQEYRAVVRDPQWQQEFLSMPLAQRRAVADGLRAESIRRTGDKPREIMDVSASAVRAVMRKHNVRNLIHGHTHRPAIHEFELDDAPARRAVLGDWYYQGSVLRCATEEWELETFEFATAASLR